MDRAFRCVVDLQTRLGESPVWSAADQALFFVDITGRELHRYTPAVGEVETHALDEDTGCIGLAEAGGFIAGARSGLWRLDPQGGRLGKLADNPEPEASSRFNDGRVDPAGRFLAGTLDEPKAGGQAHLYRFDERGLHVLASGLLTSNGLAFSPDGRTLYHSDTPRFTVWRYDYDPASGEIGDRREFVRLDPRGADRGRPDGAAVDSDGCYWTALYEGARVHRYDPDGRLMASHAVPARRPTMPAFGGPDLKTLYLTTARDGASPEELRGFPLSGGLFALESDIAGLPEPLFNRE
jgi:sugar lactone lactonase YvrE